MADAKKRMDRALLNLPRVVELEHRASVVG